MSTNAPTRWQRTTTRVLQAILPPSLPTPKSPALPGVDTKLCHDFLTRYRAGAPFLPRFALHLSVAVFLLSPPLTRTGLRPALSLSPDRLQLHCERLAGHRIYLLRQLTLMLKTMAGLVWGADPEVRTALHLAPYPPDPTTWRTD